MSAINNFEGYWLNAREESLVLNSDPYKQKLLISKKELIDRIFEVDLHANKQLESHGSRLHRLNIPSIPENTLVTDEYGSILDEGGNFRVISELYNTIRSRLEEQVHDNLRNLIPHGSGTSLREPEYTITTNVTGTASLNNPLTSSDIPVRIDEPSYEQIINRLGLND